MKNNFLLFIMFIVFTNSSYADLTQETSKQIFEDLNLTFYTSDPADYKSELFSRLDSAKGQSLKTLVQDLLSSALHLHGRIKRESQCDIIDKAMEASANLDPDVIDIQFLRSIASGLPEDDDGNNCTIDFSRAKDILFLMARKFVLDENEQPRFENIEILKEKTYSTDNGRPFNIIESRLGTEKFQTLLPDLEEFHQFSFESKCSEKYRGVSRQLLLEHQKNVAQQQEIEPILTAKEVETYFCGMNEGEYNSFANLASNYIDYIGDAIALQRGFGGSIQLWVKSVILPLSVHRSFDESQLHDEVKNLISHFAYNVLGLTLRLVDFQTGEWRTARDNLFGMKPKNREFMAELSAHRILKLLTHLNLKPRNGKWDLRGLANLIDTFSIPLYSEKETATNEYLSFLVNTLTEGCMEYRPDSDQACKNDIPFYIEKRNIDHPKLLELLQL